MSSSSLNDGLSRIGHNLAVIEEITKKDPKGAENMSEVSDALGKSCSTQLVVAGGPLEVLASFWGNLAYGQKNWQGHRIPTFETV